MDDFGIRNNVPKPLRADAYKLIPCRMWPTLTCCIMYDEHPRDNKKIDITVCLQGGNVVELYQREHVSSIELSDVINCKEIEIIRNIQGELLYLVAADRDVIILSSKDEMSIHRRFSNVTSYEVCDPQCTGKAKVMVRTESFITQVSLDSDTDVPQEANRNLDHKKPVISALAKKLIEANYNLQSNENAYNQLEKLRQQASFLHQEEDALLLKTSKPLVRFCNKKIVIQLEVENPYEESMNKVCLLIHNNSCKSISYTSKVFEHLSKIPYYKEIELKEIKSKHKASVVAVIPMREFKSSIRSKIEFNVGVSYERTGNDYLRFFENVNISAGDIMGKNFDVFSIPEIDERGLCMAMLSTTMKTTLRLKQKGLGEMDLLSTIFRTHLEMNVLGEAMAIHKHSPHHILHGIMITFDVIHHLDVLQEEINYEIDVYTRSPSQVLALIHFLNDKVPVSLIVTPNIGVTTSLKGSFENTDDNLQYFNTEFANSLLNQSEMTLKYLDDCLEEMNKNSNTPDPSNFKINLFAKGYEEFAKYRSNMLAEAENCFQHLISSSKPCDVENVMEID